MNKLAKYILVKQYPVDNAIQRFLHTPFTINEVSSTSKLYNHPLPLFLLFSLYRFFIQLHI